MTRKEIYGRIYGEIWESTLKFVNHLDEEECEAISSKITDGIVSLLKDAGESVESLFNVDNDEQSTVVVIDEL